jgi:hypothetical protein
MMDINYDPYSLRVISLDPGQSLGNHSDLLDLSHIVNPGMVHLEVMSFLPPNELYDLQDGEEAIVLMGIQFNSLTTGLSEVSIDSNRPYIVDDQYHWLIDPVTLGGPNDSVLTIHVVCPEPSTFLLVGVGIGGFALWGRRKQFC